MKAKWFYRSAALLLLLFAAAHSFGFRQDPDPSWHADMVVASMRSVHFDLQGFSRSYWDFFLAAGYSVGLFYIFAAILAWQLGSLAPDTLSRMRLTAWAFALCFAAITIVSLTYLFIPPIVLSAAITLCLTMGAWLSAKRS